MEQIAQIVLTFFLTSFILLSIAIIIGLFIPKFRLNFLNKTFVTHHFVFTTCFSPFIIKYSFGKYYDNQHTFSFCLGWSYLHIKMPFRFKSNRINEPPEYGITYYDNMLVIFFGYKSYHIYMPWKFKLYRISILLKGKIWEHEICNKENKDFYNNEKWDNVKWKGRYLYTTKLKEELVNVRVYKHEWRMIIFNNIIFNKFNFHKLIKKFIDVEFSNGNHLKMEMMPNESPLACLRRLEKHNHNHNNIDFFRYKTIYQPLDC